MSQYLRFISNIVAEFVDNDDTQAGLQGIYGISLETLLHQKEVHRLSGYRGESPVLVGNDVRPPSPLPRLAEPSAEPRVVGQLTGIQGIGHWVVRQHHPGHGPVLLRREAQHAWR